jgi:hypothetical protein
MKLPIMLQFAFPSHSVPISKCFLCHCTPKQPKSKTESVKMNTVIYISVKIIVQLPKPRF